MDHIASTISLDQIDELLQFSSLPYEGCRVAEELDDILFVPSTPNWNVLAGDDILGGPQLAEPVVAPAGSSPVEKNPGESSKKRKIVHRDVERQRRQEMASLYRSLRSHLPTELLKGKRSISDHVHQAVGYIKNKQIKIQDLSDRRDELKRMSASKNTTIDPIPKAADKEKEQPGTCCPHLDVVRIEPCIGGVEITISTDSRGGVALSRVIHFLIHEQGMDVIGCTSTKVNERLLHSIKSEVTCNNRSSTDNLTELKKKLMTISAQL